VTATSHPIRVRLTANKRHLVDRMVDLSAERVGLDHILDNLNRRATRRSIPALTAATGFSWEQRDIDGREWWPQGITTSADANDVDEVSGRKIVMVSWYAHEHEGGVKGTRLSVVDWTDPARPRYRHVLLVNPVPGDSDGGVALTPVTVHAGGIVWYGKYVFVAGTSAGIRVFDIDDIMQVPNLREHNRQEHDGGGRNTLQIDAGGAWHTFGYRYVLPESFAYKAETESGAERMRYSFMSLDRSASPHHHLVAGEYGRNGETTRLVRYAFDRRTGLLATNDSGECFPLDVFLSGIEKMQGATVVDGTWYVTTSNGRFRRGDLWIGEPAKLGRRCWRLAIGPEDIAYWPQLDQLWTLSEYPGRRYVFGMPRKRLEEPLLQLLRHRPGRAG
jgi:hypothetical protein